MKSTQREVPESGFAAPASATAGSNARRARQRLATDGVLLAVCAMLFLLVFLQSEEWPTDILPIAPGREAPKFDRAVGFVTALSTQSGSRAAQEPSPAGRDDLPPVFRKPNPESLDDLKAIEEQVKKIAPRVAPA